MKICVISGASPNSNDAVGDFAFRLTDELSKENQVSFIGPSESVPREASFPVYNVGKRWGPKDCVSTYRFLKREQPEVILVHFVPHLYGWLGTKPFFALLLFTLKRKGYPVVTILHEFSSPPGSSIKTTVLSWLHRTLLRLIVRTSKKLIVTTPFALALFHKNFPSRKSDFKYIPISSAITISPAEFEKQASLRSQLRLSPDSLVISLFGSTIGTAFDHLHKVLQWMVNKISNSSFLFIGKHGESLKLKFLGEEAIFSRIRTTGPVSNETASHWLSISDLYLVFYPDGASTRRTSLMTGLEHGLPTISNFGSLTDPVVASSGAIHLFKNFSDEEFSVLQTLYQDPAFRKQAGKTARLLWEKNFSWPIIVEKYQEVLKESATIE